MKKYLCSMGAWIALIALTADGQTSSSGNSQGTSSGTQGASSQGNSQGNVPTTERQNETQPGFQNQQQQPQGFAGQTNAVSNFGATNQTGRISTGAVGTNSQGVLPTGRAGETNRMFGTNSGSRGGSSYGTNRNSLRMSNRGGQGKFQDEAGTETDRRLLGSVRERVQAQVRGLTSTASGAAWAPTVHFRIQNGVVTIIGVVQSIEIKQQIEECVRQVPGVVQVVNEIEFGSTQGGGGDSDDVLLTRVRETVLPQIQVSGIDFQCQGGVVTVIGAVPREEQKQQLVTLIRQVPGVVNVTDQVTVSGEVNGQTESGRFESGERRPVEGQPSHGLVPTGRANDRDEAATETDRMLLGSVRQKVLTEVRGLRNIAAEGAWAPALHYRVANGVVTIIGAIPTIELRRVVEDCVRQVPGVVRVEDTVDVGGAQGGSGNADRVLMARVREVVLPQIQVSGIDFRCHDGVVTVIGIVPQPELKERLVTLVKQVPGVVNVTEQVTVNPQVQGQAESGRFESGERRSGQVQTSQGQTGQTQSFQVEQSRIQSGQVDSNNAVNAAVEASRTNLAPTGRTNALPPALENKQQSPPGLQNREELPPALSGRTNNATQPQP